jgi:hypothetical protein
MNPMTLLIIESGALEEVPDHIQCRLDQSDPGNPIIYVRDPWRVGVWVAVPLAERQWKLARVVAEIQKASPQWRN